MVADKKVVCNFLVIKIDKNLKLDYNNNMNRVNRKGDEKMSIESVKLFNITTFHSLEMQCSKGINIIIGGNGTGKTTLLKFIYASCEWSNKKTNRNKAKKISDYFSYDNCDMTKFKTYESNEHYSAFEIKYDGIIFEYRLNENVMCNLDNWLNKEVKSIFIPTMEMLSHSKGFLAMNEKYNMPFDATQTDIIVNAELPETKNISKVASKILSIISEIIDGIVIYENDSFYVIKNNGMKLEFSFEAEGLRKFALLWKLIRNGLLEKDSVLIWDEPEANLNPELIPVLVDILLELQRNGVQIFIATHSYNLAKYFEVKREKDDSVIFHSLYYEKSNINFSKIPKEFNFITSGVKIKSDNYFGKLNNNAILDADSKLLDEVIEKNLGD